MKSKLALVLALAAVLAVPAAYARDKDPSSPPPGQAKKEEGQQPPGQAKQEENGDADDATSAEPAAEATENEAPAADDTSAEPPGQAKKQQNAAPPGQAKKEQSTAASAQPKRQSSHVPPGQAKKASTRVPPGQAKKESNTAAPAVHAQNNGDHGAPKGKTTICHRTGSATNPYVEITISVNGMHGHDHHDDIVPAPDGGCPSGNRGVHENTPPAHERPHPEKVTICHATHSATNPFVEITISVNGLHGHGHHPGDIIPAPAGGCPPPQPSIAGGPTASVSSGGGGAGSSTIEAASVSTAVIPAMASEAPAAAPTSGVAGVQALSVGSQPLPAAKKSGGVLGTVTRSKLPFTGLPLLPFVLGGLLAIAVGVALVRRRATRTL